MKVKYGILFRICTKFGIILLDQRIEPLRSCNRVTLNAERPEPAVLAQINFWRERSNQPHTAAGKSGSKPNMEWFSEF